MNKISGPMLDRIDLHIEVTPVSFDKLTSDELRPPESSATIRARVQTARERQEKRFEKCEGIHSNAQMSSRMSREVCTISTAGQTLLRTAMERLNLSARAYDRILKVSRTIADLAGSEEIAIEHLAEAIQLRSLDGESWSG